jgi:flavodoxin
MNILIAYYSKTGTTERVAVALQQQLALDKHSVKLEKIQPLKELKASHYKKMEKEVALKDPLVDVKGFDLVLVGTPVWGFSPCPIVSSYLRLLQNAEGKRFALFATCTVLPGTTMQRMSSVLATKGANVLGSIVVKSVFALNEAKLAEAKEFAIELQKKLGA